MELSPVEEVVPEMAQVCQRRAQQKSGKLTGEQRVTEIIRGDTGLDGEDAEQCA
jgi:hypothetical protein